jgi:hypothetical protein
MDEKERGCDDNREPPPRRRRRPPPPPDPFNDPAMRFVLPVHTSGLAIAAGYVGLISVLCFPAPVALVLGILAIRHLKKNPKLHGYGRAIFAIVMGFIFSIVLMVSIAAILIKELKLG